MPHKRNPIGCEQVVGLARLFAATRWSALENVALWHERDISHSSAERVILPDTFIALDYMLKRFTRIVKGMVVYPERMRENLERSRGVIFSRHRAPRAGAQGRLAGAAYEWVQRNAMRSTREGLPFERLLAEDGDVRGGAERRGIRQVFDLDVQLRHVDAIFARVFEDAPASV